MPLWGRESWVASLHNVAKAEAYPHAKILIHPTVWPQYSNVTVRQDRQDNGPIAYGDPFYKRSPKNVTVKHNI